MDDICTLNQTWLAKIQTVVLLKALLCPLDSRNYTSCEWHISSESLRKWNIGLEPTSKVNSEYSSFFFPQQQDQKVSEADHHRNKK